MPVSVGALLFLHEEHFPCVLLLSLVRYDDQIRCLGGR